MNYENNCSNSKSFCDRIGEISEGDGIEVAIDNDVVEVILDQHTKQLNTQDQRIRVLEIEFTKNNETLNYVKKSQEELKNGMDIIGGQMLQNHNAMLTGLNNLLISKQDNLTKIEISKNEKESKVETAKIDNKGKIYIQIFIFLGSLATVASGMYIAMK